MILPPPPPPSSVRAASTTTASSSSTEGAAEAAAARLARHRQQQHALQTESMERVRAHYKIKNRTTMYVLCTPPPSLSACRLLVSDPGCRE